MRSGCENGVPSGTIGTMRGWSRVVGGLVWAWLWLACVGTALGTVTLPVVTGWDDDVEVSPAARSVAEGWAASMQGTAVSVRGTRTPDDFLEVAAVISQLRPLSRRTLNNPDAALEALRHSVGPVFDASGAPERAETLEVDGVTSLRATWNVDGVVWDTVLVPDGVGRAVVIMRAKEGEMIFYGETFEAFIEGLAGAKAPVVPLARNRWRFGGGGAMALLGVALFIIMLRTGDHADEFDLAGQRAARAQAIAAAIVAGLAYAYLATARADAVAAAGTTPIAVVAELAVVGLLVAGALLLVGRGMDPGQTKIQSAPDVGTYAQASRSIAGRKPENVDPSSSQSDAGIPAPVDDLPPR